MSKVHHYFRNPWANNAFDPQSPGSAGRDEQRAALLGKRIIEFGLLVVCVLLTKFSPPAPSIPSSPASSSDPHPVKELPLRSDPPSIAMSKEILAAHNKYRAEVGAPPLQWSDTLAVHALEWAKQLAAENAFRHATKNYFEGENLWIGGTAGHYSYTNMIDGFGSERQYYTPGIFPDVSKTGNWKDVGHYTQMVWPGTTHVGCAGATGSDGYYRLACRYSPPGNVTGQRVK